LIYKIQIAHAVQKQMLSLPREAQIKIAGAIGAQVYESEGGTLVKYAPEKPAANAEK
jgi:hypothetical protein